MVGRKRTGAGLPNRSSQSHIPKIDAIAPQLIVPVPCSFDSDAVAMAIASNTIGTGGDNESTALTVTASESKSGSNGINTIAEDSDINNLLPSTSQPPQPSQPSSPKRRLTKRKTLLTEQELEARLAKLRKDMEAQAHLDELRMAEMQVQVNIAKAKVAKEQLALEEAKKHAKHRVHLRAIELSTRKQEIANAREQHEAKMVLLRYNHNADF